LDIVVNLFFENLERQRAVLEHGSHLIKLSRQSFEPHQVILAILGIQQSVRICHKRGELILYAEELIDRIGMPLPFLPLDLDLQKTNPECVWKVFAKAIADRAGNGEAAPGRVSTGQIPAVDAPAIRRRAFRCD
jgi:hypothetical protein